MGGIYLSEEGKKAIEAKMGELEKSKITLLRAVSTHPNFGEMQRTAYTKYCTEIDVYKEILSSATILPVHEDWEKCVHHTLVPFFENDLPNGVIIQKNKQS